jgi:hypothetical protein
MCACRANDCLHNTDKALELLRHIVQDSITREVCAVLDRYAHDYFLPAIHNAKQNNVREARVRARYCGLGAR